MPRSDLHLLYKLFHSVIVTNKPPGLSLSPPSLYSCKVAPRPPCCISPVGQALLRVPYQGVSLLHGLPWSTNCVEPRLLSVSLFIFIEKLSPLSGFEPRTSSVKCWYATNWAILAFFGNVFYFFLVCNLFSQVFAFRRIFFKI